MIRIKAGMRVRYMLDDDGAGLIHTVVMVEPDGITTWSDALPKHKQPCARVAGFCWYGPIEDFLNCFRPLNPDYNN